MGTKSEKPYYSRNLAAQLSDEIHALNVKKYELKKRLNEAYGKAHVYDFPSSYN